MQLSEEKSKGIKLVPIIFTTDDQHAPDRMINKTQDSPLTIIDWKLNNSGDYTAFQLIKSITEKSNQLRVFVVYTQEYEKAKEDCADHYNDFAIQLFDSSSATIYRIKQRSLLIIVKKGIKISKLIDIVVDNFIQYNGVLPISVLQYMESVKEESDKLFMSFCSPFDSLYSMQVDASELDDEAAPQNLVSIIQNRIRATCSIEDSFISEWHDYQNYEINNNPIIKDKSRFISVVDTIKQQLPQLAIKTITNEVLELLQAKITSDQINSLQDICAVLSSYNKKTTRISFFIIPYYGPKRWY